MKKFVFTFLMFICFGFFVFPADQQLTIYTLKGPSGVGMIQLFSKLPTAKGFKIKIEALADSQQMAARLISGEAKIGILPPNVAAKLASTGKPIQIAAVTGEGMLSLLSNSNSVTDIKSLKGKTVSVSGQGAVPEFVFKKILIANKLNPDKDLKLDYSLAYPEIAQSLIAGRIENAILPEPFATMALSGNKNIRKVGDIQEEWAKAGGSKNYPITVLVVNADFAKENPKLIETIMNSIKNSIDWVKKDPKAAGTLVEKYKLGPGASEITAAIPSSNYNFIRATDAKNDLVELFTIFLDFAPDSIGGSLPKDDFYLKTGN
jgi:NitT/TauT family transport system substrate-binding protein